MQFTHIILAFDWLLNNRVSSWNLCQETGETNKSYGSSTILVKEFIINVNVIKTLLDCAKGKLKYSCHQNSIVIIRIIIIIILRNFSVPG